VFILNLIFWLSGILILSLAITGLARVTNHIVDHWSHAKKVIERDPVPDYWEIAKLERQIWGEAFHSEESPSYCRCDACVKKALLIKPPPAWVPPMVVPPPPPTPNPYADWSIEEIQSQAYRPPPPGALTDPDWVDEDGKPW